MQNQHWPAQEVLIGHQMTNLYVYGAHLSVNGSTAFPDMGVQIAYHLLKNSIQLYWLYNADIAE